MLFDFGAIRSGLSHNTVNTVEFYRQGKLFKKTFAEVFVDVVAVAEWLAAKGLKAGDRVGLLGPNSYEWVLLDLACLAKSFVSAAFHNNAAETQVSSLFDRFSLRLLVTTDQYLPGVPPGRSVVTFADVQQCVETAGGARDIHPPSDQALADLITVYFTSGTTGMPKPLGLSRRACGDYLDHVRELFSFTRDDKVILFLPFSAMLERLHIYTAIIAGFNFIIVPIEGVARSLRSDRPTILVGVPYLFENIHAVFLQKVNSNFVRRNLFHAYRRVWRRLPDGWNRKLGASVFKEFHAFWGGKIRLMLSGTAPAKREVLEFFEMVGLPILEGYGTSETGMITVNRPGQHRLRSVGQAFPGRELVIDDAGQILVKSPHFLSNGYLEPDCPEQERYRADGFYATGDLGHLDADGFLFITGRAKEIIVFSNGKKAHPRMIEEKLNDSKSVLQSAVFGEGRAYLVGVLVKKNPDVSDKVIAADVERVNRELPPFMRLKSYLTVSDKFTVENKGLTQTLKLNRPTIWEKYRVELSRFYPDS